jgi:eukaryotic-like serine/threonine-protein kinase
MFAAPLFEDRMTESAARVASSLADHYHIERELGAGGMATVYLAEDLKHHRKVAIKVLHAELSAILGPERFLKEIELTANLQHPHILPLFDSGSADGLLYYVMPYVDGETLRTRLDREKQLSVGDAVRIACEAADALEYAHSRGVVHRDIKPENILIQNGHALVADFGIALAVQQAGGQRMTQTGLSLGTPQYMSPEQAMGEREIGARSDIYSLGAVTYEMLAGEPPFTGPSAQAIVAKVMTSVPVPPRELRKTIPPAVEDAVLTALEKLPADRFPSAAEFARALSDTTSTSSRTAAHSRAGRSANAQHRSMVLLAAIAIIASAAAAWGWLRPRSGTPSIPSSRPWRVMISFPDTAMPAGSIALSPDGSALAYAAGSARYARVWIRQGTALEPAPLKASDGGQNAAFSPDGRRIAFNGAGTMVVNVDGTGLVAVGDTTGILLPFAWADEDHLIVASKTGLSRMAVQGGGLEVVARTDSGESATNPSVLPDGHGFLFTVVPRDYADLSRYRIEMTDGRPNGSRVLMSGILARYVPGHLLVVRADGSLFAFPFDLANGRVTGAAVPIATGITIGSFGVVPFDAAANGRVVYGTGEAGEDLRDLVRVARDGKVTPLDTSWVGDFESVAASRNGEQVATFTVTPTTQEIEVHDLRTGAANHYAIPGLQCRNPIFSTVGSTLYFTGSSATGNSGVYRVEPGSAAPPRTVFQLSNHLLQYLALTPGDARMLYDRFGASEAPQLFAHALVGAATPDASVQGTAAAELAPAVSPDGRWLAYVSIESGAAQLYVRSMDSSRGGRWQVTQRGPGLPRWSHDGRELFYFAQDSMMVADVTPGAQFKIGKPHGLFSTAGFMSGDEPFDVLPGGAFLMIRRHVSRPGAAQLVMLERWDAGLTSGNHTQ